MGFSKIGRQLGCLEYGGNPAPGRAPGAEEKVGREAFLLSVGCIVSRSGYVRGKPHPSITQIHAMNAVLTTPMIKDPGRTTFVNLLEAGPFAFNFDGAKPARVTLMLPPGIPQRRLPSGKRRHFGANTLLQLPPFLPLSNHLFRNDAAGNPRA
jgi:hypothetical protein